MPNYYKKVLIIFIFFLSQLCISYNAYADTKDDLTSKINSTKEQIRLLDKEIQQYQEQISTTNQESQTLSGLIKELTLTRDKLLKETNQTAKKIDLANHTIVGLESDIKEKNKEINVTKRVLQKSLYELYQNDQMSFVELLLQADKINEASLEYQSKIALNNKINGFIDKSLEIKKNLEVSKDKTEVEHKNLNILKNKLLQEKVAIDVAKSEKAKILNETKNKESEYKKLLAERQKKRDDFEKEFRDYESKLEFLLNPKLLPAIGTGSLSWPLDKVYITQLFGKTSSSGRLYASGSHSGVDFRASIGTPVKAMGSGKVMGTGNTDTYCKGASFGKWVFIQYDNGLSSTFGHLSVISAKKDDVVKAGDVVGLSGNTGHSTGPHLHVSVYASQGAEVTEFPSKSCPGANFVMPVAPTSAYLDPIKYLPALTADILKKDTPRD